MNIYLKHPNSLSLSIRSMLWKFVRGDAKVSDFELWVYTNDELRQAITELSYEEIALVDYKEMREVEAVRTACYELIIQFPEPCLCCTFPNNTLLYPFTEKSERIMLEKQIFEFFKPTINIENFSGRPPIHKSKWYHPAKLCNCSVCNTWWFVVFEESDCDYYLVRLEKKDALAIEKFPNWPNENWPSALMKQGGQVVTFNTSCLC